MSKRHEGVSAFQAAEFSDANALTAESLQIVEQRYGSGYPYFSGGESPLCYHNRHHSQQVSQGAEVMCEALGLSRTAQAIGKLAGSAHDIVQLKPRGIMEQESADWLTEKMFRKSFNLSPMKVASLAILGTEPIFEGGRLRQKVSELTYPSKEAELIAMSVACADLGELYAPLGPRLGHELYKEIKGVPPNAKPPMKDFLEFQKGQIGLVRSYRFPHPKGEEVFGGLRSEVIEYHEDLLYHLEQREITTWDQVMEADDNFRWTFS